MESFNEFEAAKHVPGNLLYRAKCKSEVLEHEREQCLDLYKESSSMMANRNLLAPKPPGSFLIESPYERATHMVGEKEERNLKVVSTVLFSATQKYKLRRQSRERMCQKDRRGQLKGKGGVVRETPPISTAISRVPSRYLLALFKFKPEYNLILDLMLRNDNVLARSQLLFHS